MLCTIPPLPSPAASVMNAKVSSIVIRCALFFGGVRRKPTGKVIRILDAVIDSIVEIPLFAYIFFRRHIRSGISLSTLILHASNFVYFVGYIMIRRWAQKRHSVLSDLAHGFEIPPEGCALLAVNFSFCISSCIIDFKSFPNLSLVLVDLWMFLLLDVRYTAMTFLAVLLFMDASKRLLPCAPSRNHWDYVLKLAENSHRDTREMLRSPGMQICAGDDDFKETALRGFEGNCRRLARCSENIGNVQDYMVVCAFAFSSLHVPMMLMSRCPFRSWLLVRYAVLWAPLLWILARAQQTNGLMTEYRARIRSSWLDSNMSATVYTALYDKFSLGFRWIAHGRVLNLDSAMGLVCCVMIYSSLVLTTSLFQESNDFNSLCPPSEENR